MISGRASSESTTEALARIHDGLDALTARSALRSLALAGVAVAAPAALWPETASYYLL